MRWYGLPTGSPLDTRVAPRLASWNKAHHPDQLRLREFLDDTEELLAASTVEGPWALRLDVGLSTERDLLDGGDLDNYAYPLAARLKDENLVSVWCTKQHNEQSFVRIESAREVPAPSGDIVVARTTASASSVAYKEQVYAAVAGRSELPSGPVKLELSFVVGRARNWLNLWKQTIDSLDPLLGRTRPDRPWHPLDGRIVELGMHVTVDPAARFEVAVGIAAAPAELNLGHTRYLLRTAARANGWEVIAHGPPECSDTYVLPRTGERMNVQWAASGGVLMASGFGGVFEDRYGKGESFIARFDDLESKTDRVLKAIGDRSKFPPARESSAGTQAAGTPSR